MAIVLAVPLASAFPRCAHKSRDYICRLFDAFLLLFELSSFVKSLSPDLFKIEHLLSLLWFFFLYPPSFTRFPNPLILFFGTNLNCLSKSTRIFERSPFIRIEGSSVSRHFFAFCNYIPGHLNPAFPYAIHHPFKRVASPLEPTNSTIPVS